MKPKPAGQLEADAQILGLSEEKSKTPASTKSSKLVEPDTDQHSRVIEDFANKIDKIPKTADKRTL